MALDQTKIIATRDIKVYLVAWDADNAFPADTVLWGTTWGTVGTMPSPWVEAGYTEGGLHFRTNVERAELRVDQELDPVLRPATGRDTRMSSNLAEFSAAHILQATGQGSVATTAATTAARGHDEWSLGSTISNAYYSIGFDILHPGDNEAVRFAGWKGLVLGSPVFDFLPTAIALIPLELALLPDTSATPTRIATMRDVIAIS